MSEQGCQLSSLVRFVRLYVLEETRHGRRPRLALAFEGDENQL